MSHKNIHWNHIFGEKNEFLGEKRSKIPNQKWNEKKSSDNNEMNGWRND